MRIVAVCVFVCALAAAAASARLPSNVDAAAGQVTSAGCRERANDTVDKLLACIRRADLWHYLAHFQHISDSHPGRNGHGNRDTGTAGYAASVAYVARLMRGAGYNVTIQAYPYKKSDVFGAPLFRTSTHTSTRTFAYERDWFVARGSAAGSATASIEPPAGEGTGCLPSAFAGFVRGHVALLERGRCALDTQVANAEAAGASAAIVYNSAPAPETVGPSGNGLAYPGRLVDPTRIPVFGVAAHAVGAALIAEYRAGRGPTAQVGVQLRQRPGIDYNVIADSPYGDPTHVVVIEGHLDAIYGAGMLDNASGSTTILDIALNLAKTPTRNQLRYIWFGGEEIALLGSRYYTKNLTKDELSKIAFDVDADVTATPNFDILVADPKFAHNVDRFPRNVVDDSKIGNRYFEEYFHTGGVISQSAWFGNDGTDSNSFSLVGVPNTGILTQQDCCKHKWETQLWGGFRGNYEGTIPSFNGGCVDNPGRWCDNLSNNDPFVLELVSKAVGYVTFKLANRTTFPPR